MNLYAEIILDHWRNPQNFGQLRNPDVEAYEFNPLCGDEIRLQLKLKANSQKPKARIEQVRFSGNGCAISTAAASMLTEYVKGKKLAELTKLTERDVISLLGIEIGPQRIKCATLPLIVLKKGVESFLQRVLNGEKIDEDQNPSR